MNLDFSMLPDGNPLQKMYSYENILAENYFSHIFQFQLVPCALALILGDPLISFLLGVQ